MKNILFIVSLTTCLLFSCTAKKATMANTPAKAYEVSYDTGHTNAKVLKGLLHRADIENDTSFAWFKQNMQLGRANAAAVEAFKNNGSKFKIVVFFGTWCEDSQNLVPVFYRLVDKSGYPEANITLIGVDRAKTTLNNLHTQYNLTNVPTFIVIKDRKEIGRVVEYGKYGEVDKELGEIAASIK